MLALSTVAISITSISPVIGQGGADEAQIEGKSRLTQELAALTGTAVTALETPPISTVTPDYPRIAEQGKLSATVHVEARVDDTGRVVDVRMRRSVPLFDGAAMDAVKQGRFPALTMDGKPLAYTVIVPISFSPK